MKKFLVSIFVISLLFLPSTAGALNLGGGSDGLTQKAAVQAGYSASTDELTLAETIGGVVKAALSVVGIIFTSLIVYAGYLWMNARGDEARVEKAKNIISSSIVGIIITVGAYSITAFVVPRVLEQTTGEQRSPRGEVPIGIPDVDDEEAGPTVDCCEVCTLVSIFGDDCIRTSVSGRTECNAFCEEEILDDEDEDTNPNEECRFIRVPANACR